ncbi:hypothetical protein V2J09_008220 [Rumex salicifolius]
MRSSGGCSMQQSLTSEAAITVKQAINLARRRGHAQVTPIHVANVMLVSPAGILQRACLKSHSHPLQYKALELCFNVALNRLPTTSPSPILGPHSSHYPSLSNALVAAFKRAQAHQRRGSVESQQQPILAHKIETEQLVISILDDPSVSRVMREAGFSSTQVKSNLEQAVTLEVTSPNNSPRIICPTTPTPINHLDFTLNKQPTRNEDVSGVILSLVSKKRKKNTVVVGECLTTCESVVRAVKERIERGDVPNELRNAQFLNLPLMSIKGFSREEIELKLGELRCLLKGCLGRSIVLYLGDLKWVSEYWGYYYSSDQRRSLYCSVEHMVMGIRRLLYENDIETFGMLRLLGIANFSSYIKCKTGYPSLESLLDLHPLAIPVGSLDFSLKLDSTLEGESKSIISGEIYSWTHLTCCPDCSTNFHREAQSLAVSFQNVQSTVTSTTTSTTSRLPSWLRKCKEESIEETANDKKKDQVEIKELCKKWNSICNSIHKTIKFPSSSPSPSTSISSYDHKIQWPTIFEPKWCSKEQNYNFFMPNHNDPPKPDLLSNPNSTPNSASSSEATDTITMENANKFKDNTVESLEAMISALEKRVPWQKEILPDIASTVLKCRAGLIKRKDQSNCNTVHEKMETWMFFSGVDYEAKVKVAKELAKLVFGSHNSFKAVKLTSFSSSTSSSSSPTKADSTDSRNNKRSRDEISNDYLERFGNAVRDDPHRVFYVEDVEQIDQFSQKGIKKAIEIGEISLEGGETVSLEDAIVVFSCESFSSASRACSPNINKKQKTESEDDDDDSVALDLNLSIIQDDHEESVAEFDILKSVDKQILFKFQVL